MNKFFSLSITVLLSICISSHLVGDASLFNPSHPTSIVPLINQVTELLSVPTDTTQQLDRAAYLICSTLLAPYYYYAEYLTKDQQATIAHYMHQLQSHIDHKIEQAKTIHTAINEIPEDRVIELLTLAAHFYGPAATTLAQQHLTQKNYPKAVIALLKALEFNDPAALTLMQETIKTLDPHLKLTEYDHIARIIVFMIEHKKCSEYENVTCYMPLLLHCEQHNSVTACCYLIKHAGEEYRAHHVAQLKKLCCARTPISVVPSISRFNISDCLLSHLAPAHNNADFLCWMLTKVATSKHPHELTFTLPEQDIKLCVDRLDPSYKEKVQNYKPAETDNGQFERTLGNHFGAFIDKGYTTPAEIRWINDTVGFGVFATADIPKGSFIGEYVGVLIKNIPNNNNCYKYSYSIDMLCVDAAQDVWNITRFINHSAAPNISPCNAYRRIGHVIYVANKDIKKGEQLLTTYGTNYWKAIGVNPVDFSLNC